MDAVAESCHLETMWKPSKVRGTNFEISRHKGPAGKCWPPGLIPEALDGVYLPMGPCHAK